MKAGMNEDARRVLKAHEASDRKRRASGVPACPWVGTLDPGSQRYYYYNTVTTVRVGGAPTGCIRIAGSDANAGAGNDMGKAVRVCDGGGR